MIFKSFLGRSVDFGVSRSGSGMERSMTCRRIGGGVSKCCGDRVDLIREVV